AGQSRVQGELATTAIFLALDLGRLGGSNLGLDRATPDGRGRSTARLLLILVVCNRDCRSLGCRRTTACLLLGAAAGIGLGLKTRLLLGLTARGFLALLATALFFLLATTGILDGALALLDFTNLSALKRAAACLHLVVRELVEHH